MKIVKKILLIDTSNNQQIVVGLIIGQKKSLLRKRNNLFSQILLPLVDEVCSKNKIRLEEINAIDVNKGPGSFTGLRVGLAVVNTLSWLLDIPINGKNKPVYPIYRNSL